LIILSDPKEFSIVLLVPLSSSHPVEFRPTV